MHCDGTKRMCLGIFKFQASEFYKGQVYRMLGELKDLSAEHQRLSLTKDLRAGTLQSCS